MFLSGCTGGYLTAPGTYTDESNISTVLYDYMGTIYSEDWNSAKSLCVYESDAYSTISFLENLLMICITYVVK